MISLRGNLEELSDYAYAVAAHTQVPSAYVIKDFWITECLRAMSDRAQRDGIDLLFKGGTSLSKGYKLINRFSEDIDLLCVPAGGEGEMNTAMESLLDAVSTHVGVAPVLEKGAVSGKFMPARLEYPGQGMDGGGVAETIRIEPSSWGGALPWEALQLNSLIAVGAKAAGMDERFTENQAFDMRVLAPERTLVEKLVILHEAAENGTDDRRRKTARHYYDVWCLLNDDATRIKLEAIGTAFLAREVYQHNTASNTTTLSRRPQGGYADSVAFADPPGVSRNEYNESVLDRLIWPSSPKPAFQECLDIVEDYRAIL